MSRAKAKLCKVHDLQGRFPDVILEKKDCDMIANALANTYPFQEIYDLYSYFKDLGRINSVNYKCRMRKQTLENLI